ncbi:hypothetical protein PVK06_036873 [Gossypium arboreum]|uniref:Uncharacterized protein n=1 Tax=Gossypium arboreum TaxID=29729 RepID=A0ABR0NLS2_GOSAR|nr:hypothetical protein PVK06_036873 [Gossypium arboreum]
MKVLDNVLEEKKKNDERECSIIGYLALLAKYHVLTKAVTSALLTCVGDFICQRNYSSN